jgi:hypothetical protein
LLPTGIVFAFIKIGNPLGDAQKPLNGGKMGTKGSKVFLLLDDDTVGSVKCNHFKPPSRYQGRKVIFAAPQLMDIDLLRMTLRSTIVGDLLLKEENNLLRA